MTTIDDAIARELESLKRRIYDLERRSAVIEDEPLPAGSSLEVVTCRLGATYIGVPLAHVREVTPLASFAALPEAPPWVLGLFNLRGEVMTVIDVAARLDRSLREPALSQQILVCEVRDKCVGLVVEEVLGVELLPRAAFERDVPNAPYVREVLHGSRGVVLLFSIARLVSSSDLAAAEQSVEARPQATP